MEPGQSSTQELTEAQKSRIERNRKRAQALRESKVAISKEDEGKNTIKIDGSKFVDTAGGFLIEERQIEEEEGERAEKIAKIHDSNPVPLTFEVCDTCHEEFASSFLLDTFKHPICDKCKNEENGDLIAKSHARDQYLLKDCDFDLREPPLRYLERPNPHYKHGAPMKLYLKSQVEARAILVHGSLESITEKMELREERKEITKMKKYNKEIRSLRMAVRSTLYDKTSKKHEHEFGESTYNEETDEYSHKCLTCEYSETYEQM